MAEGIRRGVLVFGGNSGVINTGTINGDVYIYQGHELKISELQVPIQEVRNTPASMLSWQSRLIPMLGRDEDTAIIKEWATSGPKIRVGLITGEGGSGKSRIASELAIEMKRDSWAAGHINPIEPTAFHEGEKGSFILIDYPEEQLEVVGKILVHISLIDEISVSQPIRILLISRQKPEYWEEELEKLHASSFFDLKFALLPPKKEHYNLFELSWRAASKILNIGIHKVPVTKEEFLTWQKMDDKHQLPLFITAYAIQLAYDGESKGESGSNIIQQIANREIAALRRLAELGGLDVDIFSRLTGLASISGGLNSLQIRQLSSLLVADEKKDIIDQLHRKGLFIDGSLKPITPDILAANLLSNVLEGLHDRAGEALWATLESAGPFEIPSCMQRMARLAYDMDAVLGKSGLGKSLVDAVRGNVDRCSKLAPFLIGSHSVSLQGLAEVVFRGMVETTKDSYSLSVFFSSLSNALSAQGKYEEALEVSLKAERIARELVESESIIYEPIFAVTLNEMAGVLANLEAYEEASEKLKEAVTILRRCAIEEPDPYEKILATSLGSLGTIQSKFSPGEESLANGCEAIEICKRWVLQNASENNTSSLGKAMVNLSNQYGSLGDNSKYLKYAKGAIGIYESLSNDYPEKYEGTLAGCLYNYSVGLNKEKSKDNYAIREALKSVEIYRRLTKKYLGTYGHIFLSVLFHLTRLYNQKNDNLKAIEMAKEAVNVSMMINEHSSGLFGESIAESYEHLSQMLLANNQKEEAIISLEEQISAYGRLAEKAPDVYGERYVQSLFELALGYTDLDNDKWNETYLRIRDALKFLSEKHPVKFMGKYDEFCELIVEVGIDS